MSINKVIASGNLTRDAELQKTYGGSAFLKFGLAVNDRVKRGDNWEDYPNFIDCTLFGKHAESLGKYLKKGAKVVISGKLHYSSWEDHDTGQKRHKIEVTIEDIELMAKHKKASHGHAQSSATPAAYADEDLPF